MLEQKENVLDDLIVDLRRSNQVEVQTTQYGYVTCQDLNAIDMLKEQLIVVIKAPPEAKLVLPDTKVPREIFLKSEKGEIDVFLCPDHNNPDSTGTGYSGFNSGRSIADPLLEDIDPMLTPIHEKYQNSSEYKIMGFCYLPGSLSVILKKKRFYYQVLNQSYQRILLVMGVTNKPFMGCLAYSRTRKHV